MIAVLVVFGDGIKVKGNVYANILRYIVTFSNDITSCI